MCALPKKHPKPKVATRRFWKFWSSLGKGGVNTNARGKKEEGKEEEEKEEMKENEKESLLEACFRDLKPRKPVKTLKS